MTPHVGFLADLPVRAILDGELVALDADGKRDFPLACEWLLQRSRTTCAIARPLSSANRTPRSSSSAGCVLGLA
jgi:hypothetical protein